MSETVGQRIIRSMRRAIGGGIMRVELERETDGRWLAEMPYFPGAMAYGRTQKEAVERVMAIICPATKAPGEPVSPENGHLRDAG